MNNAGVAPVARRPGICVGGSGSPRRGAAALAGFLAVVLTVVAVGSLRAQDEHRHKVPGLDKIMSAGPGQQEFNGRVQSLDMHSEVLNVQSLREDNVEIFPIKKGVRVTTANGEKLSLEKLEPGTNVLVYYEQKGDRRSVKGIIVLSAAPAGPKNGEQKQAKSGSPS